MAIRAVSSGWSRNRTYGVSNVTDLQSVAIANYAYPSIICWLSTNLCDFNLFHVNHIGPTLYHSYVGFPLFCKLFRCLLTVIKLVNLLLSIFLNSNLWLVVLAIDVPSLINWDLQNKEQIR